MLLASNDNVPADATDGSGDGGNIDHDDDKSIEAAGKVVGSAAILRDVTARFQREKALGKRLKELQQQLAGR